MPDNFFTDEELKIAQKIITFSRREAARKLSFLEKGIYYLTPAVTAEVSFISADYTNLYYNPKGVIKAFSKDSSKPADEIAHCVMHCMLKHPSFMLPDEELSDACTDASVEAMLERADESRNNGAFMSAAFECGSSGAAKIYSAAAKDAKLQKRITALSKKYCQDDHSVWRKPPEDCRQNGGEQNPDKGQQSDQQSENGSASSGKGSIQEQENTWDQLLSGAESQLSMTYGNSSGNIFASIEPPSRFSKFSYKEYLKKFAAAEIIEEDPETFDLMLYTAGMDMYEDICFVEPYEVREAVSPTDIIFAIDMSGSCGGDIAVNFLRQIYTLFETMNIKSGVNIHVLFFDTDILGAEIIRSKNDAEKFIKNYTGHGFGGTDFNCVFNYANMFSEKSGGKKLKGLFFFSDACGSFPYEEPSYKTTFFVPSESCGGIDIGFGIPDWVELVKYDDR